MIKNRWHAVANTAKETEAENKVREQLRVDIDQVCSHGFRKTKSVAC